MGHTINASATPQHGSSNMQPRPNQSAHSSIHHSTASTHVPLSPYSATHSTFHRSSAACIAHSPQRNPLTPSYTLSSYPICTPPPPAFVHSSLDISDIPQRQRQHHHHRRHTRDNINVHDIDGAKPQQLKQNTQPMRPHQQQQPQQRTEPTGLLRYVQPAFLDTSDTHNDRADEASTAEPFSPSHFTCPVTSTTPPSRPRSSPPLGAATTTTYRSPYTRFAHSPHVLIPPSARFADVYHTAVPSTDPLPAFRCTLNRTCVLPSNYAPLGGVDGSELDDTGSGSKAKGRWKHSKRMKGVSARVQCWRVSEGEVERNASHGGVGSGGQWQRIRVQDIELVSSLTL